jgi:hypothetical protein
MRSDPPDVTRFDEEHLRRFLTARRDGDAIAMRRWWNELVVDFFDRMDGFVAAAHKGRLDDEEHEIAVELSLTRFSTNLITTFEGISMGQLVNACKVLASNICKDVQRASIRRREHERLSLDVGWDADSDERVAPSWEADEAVRRFERQERAADVRDFLDWAMPQLRDDRRAVLMLTFEGLPMPEITGTLGITTDNGYQLRSRGFKDLAKLKERYDA